MGSIWSHHKETYDLTGVYQTKYGKIRGRRFRIGEDRYVNAFLGIPYAEPPIGPLRFKKPQPPRSWPSVRECVQHALRAPQHDMLFERWLMRIPTSEDCLYLNIFAPEWDPFEEKKRGRAVMVWIHGGGFVIHSSANYGDRGICECLCSKGVIVVTIQYRLGVLGFAATGDHHSIPNLGLWDQAMALNWVKDNIAGFGGDPENITLFGQSAGGVCVDLLSLSPYTRDLFDKVIPMGGTASCIWALRDVRRVREATMSHAFSLGWQFPDNAGDDEINDSLMKFLRQQPAKSLAIGLTGRRLFKENVAGLCFGPVIDGDFIPESVSELRKKTPRKFCMGGATEYETLLFAGFGHRRLDLRSIDQVLSEAIPMDKQQGYSEILKTAKALYINERCSSDQIKRSCIRLTSDIFVTNGIHDYVEDMLNEGHTAYLYNFEYFNPRGFGLLRWTLPFFAATHGTELTYLFGKSLFGNFTPSATDQIIINNFTTLFTNFAKFGNPNGGFIEEMEPLSHFDKWRYMCIDQTITMKHGFQGRRAGFWRRLRDDKFHLPYREENSVQTQTDLKLLIPNDVISSVNHCNCQETQTDFSMFNIKQTPLVDGVIRNNFYGNTDTKQSCKALSSLTDGKPFEEVNVAFQCDRRKANEKSQSAAEIRFTDWYDGSKINGCADEEDSLRHIEDTSERNLSADSVETFHDSPKGTLEQDETAIADDVKNSERLPENGEYYDGYRIMSIGIQTSCKCLSYGSCSIREENSRGMYGLNQIVHGDSTVELNERKSALSNGNMMHSRSNLKSRTSSDDDIEWEAYEEAGANIW